MKLLRPLPRNRSFEQVQNHYLVEKAIAQRLKTASREERKQIYASMYDELFARVPDHQRLTRREDEQQTERAKQTRMRLVHNFLKPSTVFVEFAPGDCMFAMQVAKMVRHVYAVDISDQRAPDHPDPQNFDLIIYDGYTLDEIPENSVDVAFSDQFIEHLHPDDTRLHFELIQRILKPGGKYVFLTPHAFGGPHDISKYFSNIPEAFHLKEWTYRELGKLLKTLDFASFYGIWKAKQVRIRMPFLYFQACEALLSRLPPKIRRRLARYFVPSILMVATR